MEYRKFGKLFLAAAFALVLVPAFAGMVCTAPCSAFADEASQEEQVVSEDYAQVSFSTLYSDGKLVLPEGISTNVHKKGLILTGTPAQFSASKIKLSKTFTFDEDKPVGRLSVDGLAEGDAKVTVGVYLDGASDPISTFTLNTRDADENWYDLGVFTADMSGKIAAGQHEVEVGVTVTGTAETEAVNVMLRSVEFSQATLPTIYFDLDDDESATYEEGYGTIDDMNNSPNHSIKTKGTFSMNVPENCAVKEIAESGQTDLSNLKLDFIRGRGNSTWGKYTEKRPYTFKFDKKQDLFNMGKCKRWVLLANANDGTLMRNRMTMWLAEQLGMEYTSKCVPVEIVMNGVFYGSYLLIEEVRVDDSRVNVGEPTPQDPSGGYLLALWPYGDETDIFTTERGIDMCMKSPSSEDADSDTQRKRIAKYLDYISYYVQQTEDAIFGNGFKDADGVSYEKFMDLDSAVKYWWVQTFSNNGDGFVTPSTYLYKPQGGKLYWGPVWDFDLAWDTSYIPETYSFYLNSDWFNQLLKDETFANKLRDCWFNEFGPKIMEIAADGGLLDRYYDETAVSKFYDDERYPTEEYDYEPVDPEDEWIDDGGEEGGEEEGQDEYESNPTYRETIDTFKSWLTSMKGLVDKAVLNVEDQVIPIDFMVDGEIVETHNVPRGRVLSNFPKVSKKGYIFLGWYKADGSKVKIYEDEIGNEGITLTARFVEESKAIKATNIYFNTYKKWLTNDDQYTIGYTITPFDAQERSVTWTSSDEDIATVDEYGNVRFHERGTVTITAELKCRKSASITITFGADEAGYPDSVSLNKYSMNLAAGGYGQVLVNCKPSETAGVPAEFESLNKKIAIVDENGVVKGLKPGVAKIEVYVFALDKRMTCKVTVGANPLKVKGKTVTAKASKLQKKAVKIAAKKAFKVTNKKSTGKITYKRVSGNSKIKVAKNGKITVKKGLKKGTYKVKVKVTQKKTAKYMAKTIKKVTVKVKVR